MGVVFLATQTSMNRDLAMKMLHPSLNATSLFAERFRREAEVVSRLKHPHIISIYDFGQTPDGLFYYTMEMLEGENLKALVKRDGPMALGRAVAIVEQIAGALGYAHSQSILHRDMKPHNVMCARIQGKDFVKVLDFGLVKMVDEEGSAEEHLTTTGQILGTPAYMSPEQAAGDPLDGRSDLYSLGVVLYYLLAGSTPYKANSAQKLLALAMGGELPAIKERRARAPCSPTPSRASSARRSRTTGRIARPTSTPGSPSCKPPSPMRLKSILYAIPGGGSGPGGRPAQHHQQARQRPASKSGGVKNARSSSRSRRPRRASSSRSLMLGACIGLGVLGVAGAIWVFAKPPPVPVVIARPVEPTRPAESTAPAEPTKSPSRRQMATVKVATDPARRLDLRWRGSPRRRARVAAAPAQPRRREPHAQAQRVHAADAGRRLTRTDGRNGRTGRARTRRSR